MWRGQSLWALGDVELEGEDGRNSPRPLPWAGGRRETGELARKEEWPGGECVVGAASLEES